MRTRIAEKGILFKYSSFLLVLFVFSSCDDTGYNPVTPETPEPSPYIFNHPGKFDSIQTSSSGYVNSSTRSIGWLNMFTADSIRITFDYEFCNNSNFVFANFYLVDNTPGGEYLRARLTNSANSFDTVINSPEVYSEFYTIIACGNIEPAANCIMMKNFRIKKQ